MLDLKNMGHKHDTVNIIKRQFNFSGDISSSYCIAY